MGIFDFIGRKQREREQIELEFIRERNEIRLDHERRKKDLDLRLKEKKQDLDEKILEYKIRDAEARIEEEFSQDPESDDDSEETKIMNMFAPMIKGLSSPHTAAAIQQPVQSPTVEVSKAAALTFNDDEIEEIYKALPPEYKKIAKSAPDQLIRKFVLDRYPTLAEECLNRMILRVKR